MGKIYAGDSNGVAREVLKIYAGDANGTARQVKRVYAGDSNDVARLVYESGIPNNYLIYNGIVNSDVFGTMKRSNTTYLKFTQNSDNYQVTASATSTYYAYFSKPNTGNYTKVKIQYASVGPSSGSQYIRYGTFTNTGNISNTWTSQYLMHQYSMNPVAKNTIEVAITNENGNYMAFQFSQSTNLNLYIYNLWLE